MAQEIPSLFSMMDEAVMKELTDRVAERASSMLTDEQLTDYAKTMLNRLEWNNDKTRYWSSSTDEAMGMVFNKFKVKVGEKLQKLVDEGLFDEEADDTAKRIYKEAMESAEKFMVEALALRFCGITTDFNNQQRKMDMSIFVNQAMNDHMTKNHCPR